jgi:hypothetical protein
MSNHSTNPFGGGLGPALRNPRIGRRDGSLWFVLGLLVCVASAVTAQRADAAEIVEVRIGKHADYTRVVFELDRAAGYRIERADPTSDVTELVISFEASSIPRRIQSTKSLITQVEVEPSGPRSIARIRLVQDGLRLKEMILASPPRIVLDVLSDPKPTASVATAAKSKPAPAPKEKEEAVPSFDEPTFDDIVAQIPPEAESAPAVVPTSVVEPVVEPEPVVAAPVEPTPQVEVADEPSTSTPIEEPGAGEPEMLADDAFDSQPIAAGAAAQATPEPLPKRTPRAMVVKSKPKSSADQGGGWMTWALVGVGAIVLLLGGVLVARTIGASKETDFSDEDEMDAGDANATTQTGSDENPFGNLSGDDQQMTLGTPGDSTATPFSTDSGDTTIVSRPDEEKESESVVFGDSEEKKMEDMEVISREQVNQSLGGMPSAAGGIPAEFQQMMREMNRRVESLESRVDELVDARDRLERQVAAQTEELRVQRAAIARTQRAVRNLARPEDGEGDQEPTEPALRDPNPTS